MNMQLENLISQSNIKDIDTQYVKINKINMIEEKLSDERN